MSSTPIDYHIQILLVEDDPLVRGMSLVVLQNLGFKSVTACENPNIALYKLRQPSNRFDLIITDWCMPALEHGTRQKVIAQLKGDGELQTLPLQSGLDFCKAVKSHPQWQKIPVILATKTREDVALAIHPADKILLSSGQKLFDGQILATGEMVDLVKAFQLAFGWRILPSSRREQEQGLAVIQDNGIALEDVPDISPAQVGQKAFHSGCLKRRSMTEGNFRVPDGFVLPVPWFDRFIAENALSGVIAETLESVRGDDDWPGIYAAQQAIENSIKQAVFCEEQLTALKEFCKRFAASPLLIVRSSAVEEDSSSASWAGVFDSVVVLNQMEALVNAIKQVYASLFSDRAIAFRLRHKPVLVAGKMAVLIQEYIYPEQGLGGVLFTRRPEQVSEPGMLLSATYGACEAIVKGEIQGDDYWLSRELSGPKNTGVEIMEKSLGRKNRRLQWSDQGSLCWRENTPQQVSRFCLEDSLVRQVGALGVELESWMMLPLDVEWLYDPKRQCIYVLQARPLVVPGMEQPRLSTYRLLEQSVLLCAGQAVTRKISHGRIRIARNCEEASQLEQGDILVTRSTNPLWEPFFGRLSGLVTEEGNATCHAAIMAREQGLPAIIGVQDASHFLKNGSEVTVDCSDGVIGKLWQGKLGYQCQDI